MNRKLLLLILILSFITFRYCTQGKSENSKENVSENSQVLKVDKLLKVANSYKGVAYRAGGTSRKGMDCSGLVNTSFKQINVSLPRSSKAMSTHGKAIDLNEVQIGDLLFFDIARLKGGVNHVGLVTSTSNGNIQFIHSTTSKGVIVSSMNEAYWKKEFVKAKRIL
ncbi:hypothetical protein WH52_11580 [Tenacibaculum holothuriorum]|uniref:NlpC/P60 domain-containing protein n=1 Tax=Tenacibaculum holothuriorum TaxID=1635173 RepID=A0A1Y2PCM4_9FLAO|nr:C40 family peptidase [Tenacibaculum holothuriorum]OSY87499.1 hypothetical protein WH52_11580 [Tenacibaculum holothuriorum]